MPSHRDPSNCAHEDFHAEVRVGRIQDGQSGDVHSYVAEVTVNCADCGAPFGFKGPPAGHSWSEPRVDPAALTLHAPLMSPAELALEGPCPAVKRGPMRYEARP